jgi:hypothetical protein
MTPGIDRVYVSAQAGAELCWKPRRYFHKIVTILAAGEGYPQSGAAAAARPP